MTETLTTKLRFGWTTGTCATAAVNAAYTAMVTGECPKNVTVVTPSGKQADLEVAMVELGAGWATAGITKDAGDDPDVTHGAMICATVSPSAGHNGIRFFRGDGVGIVTKAGLPIGVGEPAINPVPRQMMTDMVAALAETLQGPQHIDIEISVPDGAVIAQKTWNPRLGIEGGISILGTSGIVRPFSCAAWIASIHRGVDVARANGLQHVIGSTGNSSENAAKARYDLPSIALMDMGDFVGGLLKYLRRNSVPKITIAGGFAKMVKLGQGATDLHSARSQVDFEALAALAAQVGLDADLVRTANSVLQVVDMATAEQRRRLADAIASAARITAVKTLRDAPVVVEIMVVGRDGTCWGIAGG
jgi:cobalt-precorrin-5B (C1)-methyltransferase